MSAGRALAAQNEPYLHRHDADRRPRSATTPTAADVGGRAPCRVMAGMWRRLWQDISHSCRSPASVACCSGSIVPVVLSAPNTGLRQPHEQAAWTPPSPSWRMVVWWSTATGALQVNDRAGQRPPHAVEGPDPGGCQRAQLVDVWRLRPGDDVVGPGHGRRLRDARHVPERRSHGSRLARFGLDQNVCGDHVTTPGLIRLFNRYRGDTSSRVALAKAAGPAWRRLWPLLRLFLPGAVRKCPARGSVPGAVTAAAST